MKRRKAVGSATALIYERIKELGDWRGKMLARGGPEIVEERKWMGRSHGGIVAEGAVLKDPFGLFNSSLDGNVASSTSTKATRSMRRP